MSKTVKTVTTSEKVDRKALFEVTKANNKKDNFSFVCDLGTTCSGNLNTECQEIALPIFLDLLNTKEIVTSSEVNRKYKAKLEAIREEKNRTSTEKDKNGKKKLLGDIWYKKFFNVANGTCSGSATVKDNDFNALCRYLQVRQNITVLKHTNKDNTYQFKKVDYIPNIMKIKETD